MCWALAMLSREGRDCITSQTVSLHMRNLIHPEGGAIKVSLARCWTVQNSKRVGTPSVEWVLHLLSKYPLLLPPSRFELRDSGLDCLTREGRGFEGFG